MMDEYLESNNIQKPSFVIHTLGRFDVFKDGRSLVMSSSGSRKIWELYKFMLAHRERSFTPESLMDLLWVSEEYNDPRSTLRRQMHRLRKALIEEDCKDCDKTLLFSNGYYRWNDSLAVQLDTDLFERLAKQGDALKNESPHHALEFYLKALDLYGGDYLMECVDQHWVFPIRNHYRRLFLETVLNTISLLKFKNCHDEILPLCEKAIQIDIYEETFHINLMDALSVKGERKQALEHYEYITGFYYREMGIKPSAEMRAVYKRLLRTQSMVLSEEGLYDELESNLTLDNAFYCEPEVFKSIYELERRRAQRLGAGLSVGVVTATPIKGYTGSQEELRMNHLKQHLMEYLRKGDTFTRWNDQQLLVLLPGVDSAQLEKVLKRVLNVETGSLSIVISQITHLAQETQLTRLV